MVGIWSRYGRCNVLRLFILKKTIEVEWAFVLYSIGLGNDLFVRSDKNMFCTSGLVLFFLRVQTRYNCLHNIKKHTNHRNKDVVPCMSVYSFTLNNSNRICIRFNYVLSKLEFTLETD